jgi:hypothetical protein
MKETARCPNRGQPELAYSEHGSFRFALQSRVELLDLLAKTKGCTCYGVTRRTTKAVGHSSK